MARKSHKQSNRNRGSATSPFVARSRPAASRVWDDLPQSRPGAARPASGPHRGHTRRQAVKAPTRRTYSTTYVDPGAIFGTWTMSTPTPSPKTLQAASTCARRHVRREVLFATRSTGAGSKGRRLHFTNRRC